MKDLAEKDWMQLDSLLEGHENLQKNLKTHTPYRGSIKRREA